MLLHPQELGREAREQTSSYWALLPHVSAERANRRVKALWCKHEKLSTDR